MALGGTSSVVMLDLAHSHGQMHRRMHLSCRTASPCHNASRSGFRLNLSSKDSTRSLGPIVGPSLTSASATQSRTRQASLHRLEEGRADSSFCPLPPFEDHHGGLRANATCRNRRHDQAWLAALERCAAPKSPWSVLQACIATGSHSRLMMLPTPRRTRPRSFGGRSYCAAAAPRRKQPHSVELDGAQSGGSYCSIRASSGSSMAPASTSVRMTVRWPRKLASMSAVWPHESRASTSRSSVPSSTRTMSM